MKQFLKLLVFYPGCTVIDGVCINDLILSWVRFVQAAVSLAVVIPCLLELQEQHYGVKKGIPTLVMAAASFDNVLCISAFGVCLGIAFDSGSALS